MHSRRVLPAVVRIAAAALLVAHAPASEAQTPVAAAVADVADRWAPWAGCWSPIDAQAPARDLRVCVVPTADRSGARLVTFAGDRQLNEETILPDGTAKSTTERGCQSERRTRWASAGPRLFSNGQVTCDGQAAQPFSAISTLLSRNRWLDVQVTGSAGREVVRMAHYARSTEAPPEAIADAMRAQPPSSASLVITTPRVNIDDVIEASQAVASAAVEMWLVETEPRLALNRRALQSLSAAKVSEPVIDLLVGLAYPKQFEVRRQQPGGGGFSGFGPFGFGDSFGAFYGPWDAGWDPYGMYASMYSPFGLGLYGPGFYPYSYGGYYYGNVVNVPFAPGGSGGIGEPVASGTGVAVNGRGYTRVQPREIIAERTSSDRGDASSSLSSGGGDAGGGGGGGGSVSPAGYSSGDGGGAGGGNFAVPR